MMAAFPKQVSSTESGAHFNLCFIRVISLVAAMGGLLFGYDWVVIGGAKPFFEPFFRLASEQARGWANSCALLGCLAGAALLLRVREPAASPFSSVVSAMRNIRTLGSVLGLSFLVNYSFFRAPGRSTRRR